MGLVYLGANSRGLVYLFRSSNRKTELHLPIIIRRAGNHPPTVRFIRDKYGGDQCQANAEVQFKPKWLRKRELQDTTLSLSGEQQARVFSQIQSDSSESKFKPAVQIAQSGRFIFCVRIKSSL